MFGIANKNWHAAAHEFKTNHSELYPSKKVMLKLKEQLQIVSQLYLQSVGIALQDFYRTIEAHD